MNLTLFRNFTCLLLFIFGCFMPANAQDLPTQKIKQQIESYKKDARGPYNRIRWFCDDGTMREPKDPCPDKIGGVQHASYKEDVIKLGKEHHIFLGEILANTDQAAFWDEPNNHSRLKQYQLSKYLESIDDGWIQRKSQFYRGAIQSEDEQAWGIDFYETYLRKDARVENNYFLLRQSLRDIPHDGDSNLAQQMRSQSKIVADEFPKFMDARIKIHGNPSVEDVEMVKNFQQKNEKELPAKLKTELSNLLETMYQFYAPMNTERLKTQVQRISKNNKTRTRLLTFLDSYSDVEAPERIVPALADMLCVVRTEITEDSSAKDRLLLLDLSNALEDALLKKTQEWQPKTLLELMEKIRHLSLASAGTGLIELWEWQKIESQLEVHLGNPQLSLAQMNDFLQTARGVVEWSAAMVKANYQDIVDKYTTFEPLAYGFIDDRVRSSVALDLGESVSELGARIAKISNISNNVMDIAGQSSFRGLNPGYAFGELVVISGSPENVPIDTKKIYIFQKPPSDLKPVAGIMTVSEGNLVSHVQLLARNLGIPNAALSGENLKALLKYDGQKIMFAVSEKGNVLLKPEKEMTQIEKDLFSQKERNQEKIAVPVEQIRLDIKKVLNMREVDASDSGKLCGPKAANLGQLKKMFPENVVEGLVIPFGIFREHMDQAMPGEDVSYWQYLNTTFQEADGMRASKISEEQVETYQLGRLSKLKTAIEAMPLNPAFVSEMERGFKDVFGSNIGNVPVFLRSDTNMEDLKEFTGAGLNLTLFNILSKNNITEGIKKVWASPYTERSFKWRQKYLSNPENVFPSILIIPSVDVEYSGVLITKGINSRNEEDLTVAFSWGAGGAVDGQNAETRLITKTTTTLLAPAREEGYLRLPVTGGTTKNTTTFEKAILNEKNITSIRDMASEIRNKINKETSSDYTGAWDVELGFANDKLWLFQIRPFVENKRAKSSEYLQSITPQVDYTKKIYLDTKL